MERRYPFGPSSGIFFFALAFFGACGAVLLWVALTDRVIRLWPTSIMVTGAFAYVLSFASFGFVAALLLALVRAGTLGHREIVLTEETLEFPKNVWSRRLIRCTQSEVHDVRETSVAGTQVLEFRVGATRCSISNRVVNEDGYAAVRQWLAGAPRGGRSADQ